ncbi:hypothetical protein [Sphingomonas aerophila]|jgi:hypothetical protein|uniref:Thiamine biosynthesis protein ThiC n=1 Tax=Sphingomonas aerophila TaxID=1344948 RepID=A0A7W9BF67_9SPHN|nr:hypothetical protein [Sphingomonas aerophila]MBB5716109.1 thiamine biosynthesis protein ThiC [Sphingomonas aerophila]
MRDSDTFTAHATRCRQEADAATLDNVRDRSLRAEAAWAAMAERSLKSETARDAREARPLEEVAPEVFLPTGR